MRYTNGLYATGVPLCPDPPLVFRAFRETSVDDLKIVVLGQDPYHDGTSASGLAFGNNLKSEKPMSPSLRRILAAVPGGATTPMDLSGWAQQGVLLLNSALTVHKGRPGSYMYLWRPFTEEVLRAISLKKPGTIFFLWGSVAKQFRKYISPEGNYVLEAEHPMAGGYQGRAEWDSNGCFTHANNILQQQGKSLITW